MLKRFTWTVRRRLRLMLLISAVTVITVGGFALSGIVRLDSAADDQASERMPPAPTVTTTTVTSIMTASGCGIVVNHETAWAPIRNSAAITSSIGTARMQPETTRSTRLSKRLPR